MGIDISAAFGMPPEDAVRFFEQKGYAITWSWKDLWQEAQAKAFTAAGVTSMEVLQDIQGGLKKALAEGKTQRQFADQVTPTLKQKGWWGRDAQVDKATGEITGKGLTPARLSLIYQQNLQTSFMAGRYKAMAASVDTHPYWQYVAIMDRRTRPAHAALNGLVFRADDPIWDSIFPPNGFRCRCRVRPYTQAALDREGLSVADSRPFTTQVQVPVSPRRPELGSTTVTRVAMPGRPAFQVDAGFNYNPGKSALGYTGELLLGKAAQAGAELGALAVQTALKNPAVLDGLTKDFSTWADGVTQRVGELRHVGALSPAAVRRLAELNVHPQSAVISVRDADVIHTHRDGKANQVPWDWYRELPAHLVQPQAVLLDQSGAEPAVLLAFDIQGKAAKLVVKVDYQAKDKLNGKRVGMLTNIVRSGKMVNAAALAGNNYKLLDGKL